MLIGSILQIFPFDFKPSTPPSGSFIFYVRGTVIYLQDSSGTEYPFGSTSAITALTGDVSAAGPGSAITTVDFVGGSSATSISSAAVAVAAATDSSTPSTLALRDASGNISFAQVHATVLAATGSISGSNFSGSSSGTNTGDQTITLTGDVAGSGTSSFSTSILDTVVTGKLLTGYSSGVNTPILATDNILDAFEKLQAQVSSTSSAAITALTGDVTATGPGSAAATVASVGGSSAANIHIADLAVQNATASNTASTLVERDASGNFAANVITAATFVGNLTGNASGSAVSFTGSLFGDVTGTQGVTVVSTVGGSSAADIHSAELIANAATSINTTSTVVRRDASGNFAANQITADLIGNASGSAATFTGPLSGDVIGTQSSTSILDTVITSKLLTGLITGTNTAILATDSLLVAFQNLQAQVSTTSSSAITALTGDATATGPGSAALTLATVNSNVGSFGSSTSIPSFTVNAKGLITAASGSAVIAPAGTLSGTTLNSTVVSSSLTSVGTITTGVWNGTAISGTYIASSTVANVNLAQMAAYTVKANQTATPSNPVDVPLSTVTETGSAILTLANWSKATIGSSAPTITVTQADSSLSGYLSSTDWNAFNSKQTAGNYITALTGDVTATGPGSTAATVASVGGSSAANIHTAELLANAATNINTVSTIIKRDASGKFQTGGVILEGSSSGSIEIDAPATVSSYVLKLPTAQGTAGTYPSNDGSGNISWTNPVTNIDGGTPSSNYVVSQYINGGTP